jgi:ATP-binding cassette subfamily C (CFTR/MRP) protein 1
LQLAALIIWVANPLTDMAIMASATTLVCDISVLFLITREHRRTTKPSSLLTSYLITAIISSVIEVRTLAMRRYLPAMTALAATMLAAQILLLALETRPKNGYIRLEEAQYGPEHTSGIIGRALFCWLNPLIRLGHHKVLVMEDCYPLDRPLGARLLGDKISLKWERCKF